MRLTSPEAAKPKDELRPYLAILGIVFLLIALGTNFANRAIGSNEDIPNDFLTYWLASRMVLAGGNPYDPMQWATAHSTYEVEFIANQSFLYPIPMAIMLIPLGLLPLKSAFLLWSGLALLMITIAVILLLKSHISPLSLSMFLPLFFGILLFRGTITSILNGQIAPLLFLFLSLAVHWFSRRRDHWAGLAISFLLLKPSIGGPLTLLMAIGFLATRNWAALMGLAAGSMSILLLGSIYSPRWIVDFVLISIHKASDNLGYAPTLWGIAGAACGYKAACTMVGGALLSIGLAALILGFFIRKRSHISPPNMLALALPVALVSTPYLWAYDHLLAIIPLILLIKRMEKHGVSYIVKASPILIFDLLALLLVLLAFEVGFDVWSALVPLSVLWLTVTYELKCQDPAQESAPHESPPQQ